VCIVKTNPGKSRRARALAHYYNTPVLLVDDVVTEALYYSGTSAAVAARLMCTEAHAHAAEPSSASDDKPDRSGHRPARMYCLLLLSNEPLLSLDLAYLSGEQLIKDSSALRLSLTGFTLLIDRYHQEGKTNLDLLEQEIVSGSGINWTICKSAP